ncbi:acetate/propionate family kinase [Xylanimonas ulmi]|uniref:Acetate kinase n=1 Tax=Xylanimonas ulmi TaxID=228973 RepID=A0A4Q7MAE9_9MICO|nr:acetate kinase [Xylanibacterium ulmi]RZS63209.1 acetate kinase [Xylanibacterium ulmi]
MSTVLVLNSGSSSLKYQLVNPDTGEALAVGLVEKIGEPLGVLTHEVGEAETMRELPIPDHGEALRLVLGLFDEVGPSLDAAGVVAVGHRVVHGGTAYSHPTVVDDDVVAGIEALIPLAPLHNPANVTGIKVARELLDVPHVAVFDTAFFASLPESAYTYAIDAAVAKEHQIRRYGFHGTSHEYVSQRVAQVLGRDDLKQIVLHLGNGASASAVASGVAVDTSMGLTPLEGLVMGTRSGDLDPAIVFHLRRVAGLDVDEIDNLLNKRSGLKGIAGRNDMREVRSAAEAGDPAALLALAVYRHRLVKYVGAYAAVLGGVDVLTFTAGVGENSAPLREEVVEALAFLGLAIDPAKNAVRSKEPRVISPDGHEGPLVMVVPTNEELAIARLSVAAIA